MSATETVTVKAYYKGNLVLKHPMQFVVVRRNVIAIMEQAPPEEIVPETRVTSASDVSGDSVSTIGTSVIMILIRRV